MLGGELRKLKVWSCSKLCDSLRWLNKSESRDISIRAVNLKPVRDNGLNFPDTSHFQPKASILKHANLLYAFCFISDDDLCYSIRSELFIITDIELDYTRSDMEKRNTHFHHQLSQKFVWRLMFASVSMVNEIIGLVLGPDINSHYERKMWLAG